ncbi:DUF4238 domain-containing protein [Pleionea sediminis]|uniref:DUF4238 domain-containing protein n=1 Tax=Pleionea sediminis TaxID=2569479 RepID=UPI00118501F7|nr:DUF4238 domain-containing protein [Pleionea sediminis]
MLSKKDLEIKTNHHYVWAHYLSAWAVDGRNVWYTTKKNKIVSDSVKGLAKEKYFYQVPPLDTEDSEFLKDYISRSSFSHCVNHCLGVLMELSDAYSQFHSYEKKGDSEGIERCKALFSKAIENRYEKIERDFRASLSSLCEGNLAALQDLKMRTYLLDYVATQYWRTPYMKSQFIESVKDAAIKRMVDKNWWMISYVHGYSMGSALISQTNAIRFTLLKCPKDMDFITSDNPVINTHSLPLEYADLYFPVCPEYAVIASKSGSFKEGLVELDESETKNWNLKIDNQKYIHAFATTKETLEKLHK